VDRLRVRVLGDFEVEGVPAGALGSRKGRSFVKLLALGRGRPVSVDRIVEALWGDRPPARPAAQVQVLASRARGALGADRVIRTDAGYRLALDWLDVDACEQLVTEAERCLGTGRVGAARAAAAAALALARGPLLADEPDAWWADPDRTAAERLAGRARHAAAEAALAAGDLPAAAAGAAGALDLDPYDEVALRILMAAQARAGRPASALAAYARVRARLAEDLGVSPAPETEALHSEILLGTPPGPPSPPPGRSPGPLAGRERELATLDAALARAAEGHGGLVVVSGEAGIGKTALVSAWAAAARSRATVLAGTCDELARGLPMQAVLDAIEGHLGTLDEADVEALLGPDGQVLGPLFGRGPVAPPLLALAAPVLNPYGPHAAVVQRAVVDLLARLAAPASPLVLVLDDVHLAGEATVALLHLARRRLAARPVLVVVTQRAEEAVALPATAHVRLGPLDLDATSAVVGPDRAADLLARSGGHPLLLVELAEAPPGEELPASLRDAVIARCERAGPDVATTLRAAAVLGETVDLDLLAATLGASPISLLAHLEEGVRRMILDERGPAFVFRHALVRAALESGTSAARRALLHRNAAHVLARRARADPLAVAHHARLGGDADLAAAALVDAATVAAGRADHAEAERLLGASIELADTARARVARGRVRLMAGRLDEADADAAAAMALGAGGAAMETAAWVAHYRRDFQSAVRLADEGARLAADPGVRAACLMAGGYASHCRGDLAAAESRLRAAAAAGAPYESRVASMWLGALLIHRSDTERGLSAVQAARRAGIAPAHADPHAHALFFEAIGLAVLGRADEALAAVATLEAAAAGDGPSRWPARAANIRGWILRNLGDHGAADEANEAALALAAAAGQAEPVVHAHLDLATGRLMAADPDAAGEHLGRAAEWRHVPHSMGWRNELRGQLLAARLALLRGEPDGAAAAAGALAARAEALGIARYRVLAALVVADARLRRGEPVDLAGVDRLLAELPAVAGLEAWWITADLADAADVDAWRRLADERVAALAAHAGPHRRSLEREAARRTGAGGTRPR
jgi:DNA-binding SARP family transcriptional activator